MKKRCIVIFLFAALCVTVFGLVACSHHRHNWGEEVITKEPTCTTEGRGEQKCLDCGEVQSYYIESLGHDCEWNVVREPNCENSGFRESVCKICGETISRGDIPALGHNYTSKVVQKASCTQIGETLYTCTQCGDSYRDYEPILEHEYNSVVSKPSSCSTEGIRNYTCQYCGDSYSEPIAKTDHTLVSIGKAIDADCTRDGLTAGLHCSVCGYVVEEQQTVPKLSHRYDNYGVCAACGDERLFTVTFVAYGDVVSTETYTYSNKQIEEPEIPTRIGYENVRWPNYTLQYADITVNALYDLTQYSITYKNVADEENSNPITYTVEDEITLAAAERNGYTFDGWYTDDGAQITEISKGQHENLSLSARWSITYYTITYTNTHGIDVSNLPTSYTIETNTIYLPSDVSLRGYTFYGWSINNGSDAVFSIIKGTYGDLTVSPVLEGDRFTLTLDSAGGTLAQTSFTVNYGADYKLPIPTMTGNAFLGWFSNSGSSGIQYTDENGNSLTAYNSLSSRVLYAHWNTKTFTVTYESNGGDAVSNKIYKYGATFDPVAITHPSGYLFDGWYNDDYSVKYTESTMITSNFTVYARWIESIAISTAEKLIKIS